MHPEDMAPRTGSRVSPAMIAGLVIIALGVLLLLHQNQIVNAWRILRYWPLALVAIGLLKLFQSGDAPGRVWGAFIAFVGVIFSIGLLGGHRIRFQQVWPAFVIAWGLALLWGAIESRRRRPEGGSDVARLGHWTMFGGGEQQITSRDFEGGEVLAIFGGWNLDLTRAGMKGNQAVIEANCIFGGIDLRVPEDWEVILRGTAIFGGFSDKTRHPRREDVTKSLIVRGTALFGGVEIKN